MSEKRRSDIWSTCLPGFSKSHVTSKSAAKCYTSFRVKEATRANAGHVEAGLPRLVIGDQRQRLEEGHIFEPGDVSGSMHYLSYQGWILLGLFLKCLDGATRCERCRG